MVKHLGQHFSCMISRLDANPLSWMMDWHRTNVCSNNNVMLITEEIKEGMQPLSVGEIPSFVFSESIYSASDEGLGW